VSCARPEYSTRSTRHQPSRRHAWDGPPRPPRRPGCLIPASAGSQSDLRVRLVPGVVRMNRAHVELRGGRHCELFIGFAAGPRGSWVIGANVRLKLVITPQLKVLHHFIERFAIRRARRVEDPGALGAAKTSKMLFLNPLQLPSHSPASLRGPVCRMPHTHLPSGVSSRSQEDSQREGVYRRRSGRSVGHPTYDEDCCQCARRIFWASSESSGVLTKSSLRVSRILKRSVLLSIGVASSVLLRGLLEKLRVRFEDPTCFAHHDRRVHPASAGISVPILVR